MSKTEKLGWFLLALTLVMAVVQSPVWLLLAVGAGYPIYNQRKMRAHRTR